MKQEIKLKGQNKSVLPRPKQTRAQNKISHYEKYSAAEKTKYCFVKSTAPTKLSDLLMQQVKVNNMSYLLMSFWWLQGLDQITFVYKIVIIFFLLGAQKNLLVIERVPLSTHNKCFCW